MRNIFIVIFAIIFLQNKVYAEKKDYTPIYEKNYLQIDPLYLDYQTVNASDDLYYQNNTQLVSARPSFLFYLNTEDIILRPFISLDPNLFNTQGSFGIGKLIEKTVELGLYTLLNHTENIIGKADKQNGINFSQFLTGPYIVFYPYENQGNLLQIYSRLAYEYSEYKRTISGVTTNTSTQKGVNFNFSILYSSKIGSKFYFAPYASFTYFSTLDYAGDNTTRTGIEWQIIPASFQIIL